MKKRLEKSSWVRFFIFDKNWKNSKHRLRQLFDSPDPKKTGSAIKPLGGERDWKETGWKR